MLDDKKIEEAAFKETFGMYGESESLESGFIRGAKWMQEEFLKNLLHPANEKPKRRCNYLLLHYKDKEEEYFKADVVDTKAWDCYIKGSLVEYINIDDLFPIRVISTVSGTPSTTYAS